MSNIKSSEAEDKSSDDDNVVSQLAGESLLSETARSCFIDSGAQSHMWCDKRLFVKPHEPDSLSSKMGDD